MFERKLLKKLLDEGADYVIRSAGSHGAVDVLAYYGNYAHAFQCQLDKYFPPAKIEAIREFGRVTGATVYLAWSDKGKVIIEEAK